MKRTTTLSAILCSVLFFGSFTVKAEVLRICVNKKSDKIRIAQTCTSKEMAIKTISMLHGSSQEGPQGPKGDKGDPGPQGPKGDPGELPTGSLLSTFTTEPPAGYHYTGVMLAPIGSTNWTPLATPPKSLSFTAAGYVGPAGAKAFFLEGWGNPETKLAKLELSDLSWHELGDIPSGNSGAVLASNGSKIYVFGGYGTSGWSTRTDIYDVEKDSWSSGASMPTARSNSTSAVTVAGKIYLLGGINATGFVRAIDEYDPNTNSWITKSNIPAIGSSVYMRATSVNNKIYMLIGVWDSNLVMSFYEYSPETDLFVKRKSPNYPRVDAALVGSSFGILAVGGFPQVGNYNRNSVSVEAYKIGNDEWLPLPDFPVDCRNPAAVLLQSRVFVAGCDGVMPPVLQEFMANTVYPIIYLHQKD